MRLGLPGHRCLRNPPFDACGAEQSPISGDRSHRLHQPMHFPSDGKPYHLWFIEERGATGAGRVYAGVDNGWNALHAFLVVRIGHLGRGLRRHIPKPSATPIDRAIWIDMLGEFRIASAVELQTPILERDRAVTAGLRENTPGGRLRMSRGETPKGSRARL